MSFQDLLQPVMMSQCLEARLHDVVQQVEGILSDTPTIPRDVISNLTLIHRTLNETIDSLKLATQVRYFALSHNLTVHFREHGAMPRVEDVAYDHSESSDLDTEEDTVIRAD